MEKPPVISRPVLCSDFMGVYDHELPSRKREGVSTLIKQTTSKLRDLHRGEGTSDSYFPAGPRRRGVGLDLRSQGGQPGVAAMADRHFLLRIDLTQAACRVEAADSADRGP